MTYRIWIAAGRLYPGGGAAPLADHALAIEDGHVVAVLPAQRLPRDARPQRFDIVAPGLVDLQINGGGGVLFNDAPSVATLARIAAAARTGGAAHILPTFITAPGTAYLDAFDAVAAAIAAGVPGVLGLHLEGPFLASARPGIHPVAAIRRMDPVDVAAIARFPHPLLVTLAPERQDPALVAELVGAGVRVFAGHTEASAEEIRSAAEAGLVGLTHMWNAMPPPTGRAPGPVGAALTHPSLMAGIIADGVHVHPLNLALAAQAMAGRLFLVSDAMPTLGAADCRFGIGGVPIRREGDRLVAPDGTLAGAQLFMDAALRRMAGLPGVTIQAALDMASGVPARAMGLGHRLGRIAPGRPAHLSCFDAQLHAQAVMVDGRLPG